MRIFCVADSHGRYPELRPEADLALVCGDFSDLGRSYEGLFRQLNLWNMSVYFTSGNHESREICDLVVDESNAVCIDYNLARVGNLFLAGIGGFDIFDDIGREQRVDDFTRKLQRLQSNPMPQFSILLTHEPPWPWRYDGKIRGKEFLRPSLRAWPFNLVVTGHFHEDLPRLETESVIKPTLNPGFAECLVDLDLSRGMFTIFP